MVKPRHMKNLREALIFCLTNNIKLRRIQHDTAKTNRIYIVIYNTIFVYSSIWVSIQHGLDHYRDNGWNGMNGWWTVTITTVNCFFWINIFELN